jgi:hypothetical protein
MTSPHIPIGRGARPAYICGQFANRHGLIAGATGKGKSVTLLTLAEGFSRVGVPVFMADVKGDLARIGATCPVRSLDVYGRTGAPFAVRLDSLGPDVFARALGLTDAQAGALDVLFELARVDRRPLANLADLRRLITFASVNHRALSRRFGQVAPASIAVVQRALIALERDGGAALFGVRSFDVACLLGQSPAGRGVVTLLDATRLTETPAYGAALLFMLAELFERMPEVGDLDTPRLVLFLDEAHLIFAEMAPRLLQRVERIVRLIRSKGLGVYFASQSPADMPPMILGQLGNRIQHGLHGATPADLRAIRATAETLPVNPKLDAASAIVGLKVGEALVSTIGPDGVPQPVDRVRIRAPDCLDAGAPRFEPATGAAPPADISPVSYHGPVERSRAAEARALALALGISAAGVAALLVAVRAFLGL